MPGIREEFRRLYDVVRDVATLPEYIQSEFSRGEVVKGRKFGKMTGSQAKKGRSVKRVRPPPEHARSSGHGTEAEVLHKRIKIPVAVQQIIPVLDTPGRDH